MKVTKWVDFSREIEVEIDGEDAVSALLEGSEDWTADQLVRKACSNFIVTLERVPDAVIAAQTPRVRKIIGDALKALSERFLTQEPPQ